MATEKEMPIFTRTFDFLTWLLPVTNRFPRAQRFTITARLLDAALDLREYLEEANHRFGKERVERLRGLLCAYIQGKIPLAQLNACTQGWVNHVRYGDTWGLRRALFRTAIPQTTE